MTAQVRRMTPGDLEEVAAIWDRAGLPYQPRGRDSRQRLIEQMGRECCIFLVAEEEGRIVGSLLATHDFRKGWLNRLAVDPVRQGEGVGPELVKAAEKELEAAGVRIYAAQIHRHNRRSRELFARLGYQEHEDIVYCSKRPGGEE